MFAVNTEDLTLTFGSAVHRGKKFQSFLAYPFCKIFSFAYSSFRKMCHFLVSHISRLLFHKISILLNPRFPQMFIAPSFIFLKIFIYQINPTFSTNISHFLNMLPPIGQSKQRN